MKLYIAQMLRWGDPEKHHYILGVYSTYEQAFLVCDAEKTWRACKYEPNVVEVELDAFDLDWAEKLAYHKLCIGE